MANNIEFGTYIFLQIFEGNRNYLDWDANSNLFPVQHPLNSFRQTPMLASKNIEDPVRGGGNNDQQQLSLTFWAFKENRVHFFVQVKDSLLFKTGSPSGRLQIYSSPRSHLKLLRKEAEILQQHICTLNLALPGVFQPALADELSPDNSVNHIINFASAGERRRDKSGRLCEPHLSPDSSAERSLLRLTVVADHIGKDWQKLGLELGLDKNNINIIDLQVGTGTPVANGSSAGVGKKNSADAQKAYRMLHHWAEVQGVNATGLLFSLKKCYVSSKLLKLISFYMNDSPLL